MSRSAKLGTGKRIQLHTADATLPDLTLPTEGAAVTGWRQGKQAPRYIEIAIDANGGALNLSVAWLCGYDTGLTMWRRLAKIQNGEVVVLTEARGWADTFADIGVYDRLAISGTLSANAVDVYALPVEVL